MRTNVYIDGFNLYYGCLKHTPYRWLDLARLCQVMLPRHQIHRIRYFTALVRPRPDDTKQAQQQKTQRQKTYLRALETIPNLTVHEGHFLQHAVSMPLVDPPHGGPRTVLVWKTDEKGSDVNLASHLLIDGVSDDYDAAVVISNDSDLVTPIHMVRSVLRCPIGVLNPHATPSRDLLQVATFFKSIEPRALRRSMFADVLQDDYGSIVKPEHW